MKKYTHIKNGKALMIAAKDGRKNKRIKKDLTALINIIHSFELHTNEYVNSYFWSNLGNASDRRSKENEAKYEDSFISKKIDLTLDLDFSVTMSCKNVYTYKYIYVNDNKTTARALKTIVKEARSILEQIPAKKEM